MDRNNLRPETSEAVRLKDSDNASQDEENSSALSSSSINDINVASSTQVDLNDLDVGNLDFDTANHSSDTFQSTLSQADNTLTDPDFNAEPTVMRDDRPVTRLLNAFNPFTFFAFHSELTVKDAFDGDKSSQWHSAMQEEMNVLHENHTWVLVDPPAHRKPIKCKWVFKEKTDADGKVVRHKARLVVKG